MLPGDEAERAHRAEALAEASGELLAAQGQLVQPRRVVDGHGEAAVGEGSGLRAAGRVGADDLHPGPAHPMLEQSVSQVGHRGEQKIGDGTRRPSFHDLVSYIRSSTPKQGPARAVEDP